MHRPHGLRLPYRAVLFLLGLTLALAWGPAQAQEMRTVVDDLGNEVTIPVQPQRIVALRGDQLTSPLLELGAAVVASTGIVSPLINGGQPYVRGAYDILDFRFEAGEVAFVGGEFELDLEAIAAARPDVIFAAQNQADYLDRLRAIAPTVVINFISSDTNTSLMRYRRIADFAGRLPEFERMDAMFAERLARYRAVLADQIGDPADVIVGVIGFNDLTTLTLFRGLYFITEMLRELGFSEPALLAGVTTSSTVLSFEALPQLETDFLITIGQWGIEGGTYRAVAERFEAALPGWDQFMHATRTNQWLFIDLEQARPTTFASARYVLDFLMANIALRPFEPRP